MSLWPLLAVGKNGRQAHRDTFLTLGLCVLAEEEKHSVNGDGDMGKITSKSRFTDWGNQSSTSGRN